MINSIKELYAKIVANTEKITAATDRITKLETENTVLKAQLVEEKTQNEAQNAQISEILKELKKK